MIKVEKAEKMTLKQNKIFFLCAESSKKKLSVMLKDYAGSHPPPVQGRLQFKSELVSKKRWFLGEYPVLKYLFFIWF